MMLASCEEFAHRKPVPPQRWHFTTLSPFFSKPLPSQFLHFCFFLTLGPFWLAMIVSRRKSGVQAADLDGDAHDANLLIAIDRTRKGDCRDPYNNIGRPRQQSPLPL